MRIPTFTFALLTAPWLMAALLLTPALAADQQYAPKSDDLDALLLEGLAGDEAKNLPPAANDDGAKKENEPGAASPDDHPLIQVNRQMREAERLIGVRSESTERVQTEIVDALDKLIKACEKECQCSGGNCEGGECKPGVKQGKPGAGKSKSGARDSSKELVNRKVELGDIARRKSLLKTVWGQLPKRQQEQMVEGESAQFLPKYAEMIEEYFQTLAERGGDTGAQP